MAASVLRRITRRETHSPRTAPVVLVLAVTTAAAIWTGIEIVLHLLTMDPLLVTPAAALAWLTRPTDATPPAVVVAGAALVAVLGLILIWLALSPGRRPKHELAICSHPVVVDNAVIASSLAERVRHELDLAKGAVVVGIGHRTADAVVRPDPGQSVERSQVRAIMEDELAAYRLSPKVRARARVRRAAETEAMA